MMTPSHICLHDVILILFNKKIEIKMSKLLLVLLSGKNPPPDCDLVIPILERVQSHQDWKQWDQDITPFRDR